jgi:hypothetical protein
LCLGGRPQSVTEDKGGAAVLTEVSLFLAVLLRTNPVAVKVAGTEGPPLPFVVMRYTVAGLMPLR